MARPGSLLPLPAPCGDEEEAAADESSPRLLPRSSPTPRPRPAQEEEEETAAAQAPRGEAGPSGRRVRFADALGLPLVAAQCYDSWRGSESPELPLLVGRCYGNLCCADVTLLPLVEAECNVSLCPAYSPDPAQELGALGPPPRQDPQSSFYLCPTFLPPSSLQQLEQRVQAGGVELESLLPCPSDPRALRGMLRVLNVSYSKSVYVRATFDRWTNYYDHPADYVASCDEGRTDQFAFRLAFAPPYAYDGARMEFVARYETPGQTYWANNGGRNYGVVLKACGGAPPQPPIKPVFWELEQRRLKSCLKPVKNRPAAVDSPHDTFSATVELTSGHDDVPQLLKPTPLHPERPNNQVPTLVVTSTSPEKLHGYRTTIFTEAKPDQSANKGGYVSTPPEDIKSIRKPCVEAEQRLRKDKSTWIGDLSTLRHAGAAFRNGNKDTGNVIQEFVSEKSPFETPTDRLTTGQHMICPYIPPTSDDSDNEEAVEEELEQLYLSHLSRLQAAKELKDPSDGELGQGVLKEPHVAPDWNVPVSPLDFAGTKRVLNTWLAEEISLRHGEGRDQEQSTDVTNGTVELPSLGPESANSEMPSCVSVPASPKKPQAGEGTQHPSTGEGVCSVGENAEYLALDQSSMGPRYAPLVFAETEATDTTHVSRPQESGSVMQDRTTRLSCQPVNCSASTHGLNKDKTSKDIGQFLAPEVEMLPQKNSVPALSKSCDHADRAKQGQVPLNGELCELHTQQDLKEQALLSEALYALETLQNRQEGSPQNKELNELCTTTDLQERVQVSRALHKRETLSNQQEDHRLSEDLHELQAPLNLQEQVLLNEELHEVGSRQNRQERVQLSEELNGLETPQDLEEQVLLGDELHELETSHTMKEQALLSEDLSELETARNLQERVLLNESLCELQSSQRQPRRLLLCEELPVLETPQNWQERVQLCEELHELETPQNMQERVLLSEELCGLDASKDVQDQGLLSEEICSVETAQNVQESVLLRKERHNLETRQTLQERVLMIENVCRIETSPSIYKTFLLKEELREQDVSQNPLQETVLCYLETSQHLQEPLKKDKDSGPQVAQSPIERVLSEDICETERQKNLPLAAEGHLEGSRLSTWVDEGIGYLSTSCVPLGKESEYLGTSSAVLGEGLVYAGTSGAPLDQGLGFLGRSIAPLDEHLGSPSSFSAPAGEEFGSPSSSSSSLAVGVPDQVSGPSVDAALALSSRFLCALVFLCVILQSCMSFAEALLFLVSVWFL